MTTTRRSITRQQRDDFAHSGCPIGNDRKRIRSTQAHVYRNLSIMHLRCAGAYRIFVLGGGTQKAKEWARWNIERASADRLESVRRGLVLP